MAWPDRWRETAWPYVAPDSRVLVVIPTYHEIEKIDEVLRRTRRALPDATVLPVDDNNPDGYGFQVEMAYQVHTMGGHIAEVPIEFRDRTRGRSKMSTRIVVEALWLVTRWGARDRLHRTRPLVGAPVR